MDSKTTTTLAEALAAGLPAQSAPRSGAENPLPAFGGKVRYLRTPSKPCDPLFSPPPGREPEKTRLSSHFLAFSVDTSQTVGGAAGINPYLEHQQEGVLGIAIELLVYSTKSLTTLFVCKADTTGYIPNHPPSRTKAVCAAFIKWLVEQERLRHPNRKVVVSLFARAQSQYLFPGSAEHSHKHVLDDRQLIRWWAKVLDPLLDLAIAAEPRPDVHGYVTIPGYDAQELRTYLPRTHHPDGRSWKTGHPLVELAETRGVSAAAPPRSLLPRFPDDPKARFMQDLDDEVGLAEDAPVTVSPSKRKSGRWSSVRDLARFWEAMEFRQECSSGRVVGFLWVVVSPTAKPNNGSSSKLETDAGISQESSQSLLSSSDLPLPKDTTPTPSKPIPAPKKRTRKPPLTGPIFPRQPRQKGGSSSSLSLTLSLTAPSTSTSTSRNGIIPLPSLLRDNGLLITQEGYDRAMQTLLRLDFATLEVAARSTGKWVAEVAGVCGLVGGGEWGVEVVGTAVEGEVVEGVGMGVAVAGAGAGAGGVGVLGDGAGGGGGGGGGNVQGAAAVNDLGPMVRKKRKVVDGAEVGDRPAVNVLVAGAIRKKPKVVAP